nr:hypothetical protein [Granulosicoccus sp.]
MKIKPRSWGTWTAARPVELSHLPSGFCITPVIYSNRANHPSAIPAGDLLRFGRRTLNDGVICFDTTHEDTQLKWQYTQPDPSTLDIHWHCCSHGEWGLRYWINLCFSAPTGVGFEFDRVQARLRSNNPSGLSLSAQAEKPPLMVSFHQDLGALLDEYSEKGYFYLGSRGTSGDFAVLRFNLEEAPALTCRIKLQPSDAANTATDTLPRARKHSPPTDNATISNSHIEQVDESAQGALDAIHDVVAWNHVFDPINDREYTVLTRFWNQQKFGGFGIWMNDVMYHALLWSQFDCQKARS